MEKVLAKSKNGKMLKIGEDSENSEWYSMTSQVESFAKIGVNVGDMVDFNADDNGNTSIISFISKTPITKKYTKKPTKKTTATIVEDEPIEEENIVPTPQFSCQECGAELKDDKYPTCYTCSMKLRAEQKNSPEEQDRQTSIKRQAVAHATSRVLISLQGHVDTNNVASLFNTIYDVILKKVN